MSTATHMCCNMQQSKYNCFRHTHFTTLQPTPIQFIRNEQCGCGNKTILVASHINKFNNAATLYNFIASTHTRFAFCNNTNQTARYTTRFTSRRPSDGAAKHNSLFNAQIILQHGDRHTFNTLRHTCSYYATTFCYLLNRCTNWTCNIQQSHAFHYNYACCMQQRNNTYLLQTLTHHTFLWHTAMLTHKDTYYFHCATKQIELLDAHTFHSIFAFTFHAFTSTQAVLHSIHDIISSQLHQLHICMTRIHAHTLYNTHFTLCNYTHSFHYTHNFHSTETQLTYILLVWFRLHFCNKASRTCFMLSSIAQHGDTHNCQHTDTHMFCIVQQHKQGIACNTQRSQRCYKHKSQSFVSINAVWCNTTYVFSYYIHAFDNKEQGIRFSTRRTTHTHISYNVAKPAVLLDTFTHAHTSQNFDMYQFPLFTFAKSVLCKATGEHSVFFIHYYFMSM